MSQSHLAILIRLDEVRRAELIQTALNSESEPFSDTLSSQDWTINQRMFCVLSFSENTLDYLCIAKGGKKVATLKKQITFSNFINLNNLLSANIEARIGANLQANFKRTSSGSGGNIPDATWGQVLQAIKLERPTLESEIVRLEGLLKFSNYKISGQAADIQLQERDALGIALDIFSGSNKLRETVLGQWAPKNDAIFDINTTDKTAQYEAIAGQSFSFIDQIPDRYFQEETALQHDLFNWFGQSAQHTSGVSKFTSGSRALEVIYANRNAIEHTLGVDLVYFNAQYESFVLVQYKLMTEENGNMVYRPDEQVRKQLTQMSSFTEQHASQNRITHHNQFRLNDDGFLFKLVPSKGLTPATGELIKGMYLTRSYMNYLLGENGPVGSRGGAVIDFENAPRYLTNSNFTELVNQAWIGTRGVQSEQIKVLITEVLSTGRAVVFAQETIKTVSE